LSWWDGPQETVGRTGTVALEPFEITEIRLERSGEDNA
jgi:hypothetical protein